MVLKNKKTVCILTCVHPVFDIRIFHKQAKSLSKAGYKVTLIAPHTQSEVVEGINIIPIEKPLNFLDWVLKKMWKFWRKAVNQKADIYHFHDIELIPIGLLLKLQGKKVIYDSHEDAPQQILQRQYLSKHWIAKKLRIILAWIFKIFENFAAKQFDIIITATPFIRDRFKKIGCNAIDVNNFPILSELHIPNIDWSKKECAVCYVGGISEIRGIYEMIDAIDQTNAKLLLAGSIPTSIYDRASNLSGWSKVEALGYINRDEVKEVLSRSMAGLVLLHPTSHHIDSQPIKMFEYMSAGIPIIASDFPLWKEIIEENQCGICVDPLDPQAIAQAIEYITTHLNEAKQMGENGRKAVEEKYNWTREEDKLLLLYKEL